MLIVTIFALDTGGGAGSLQILFVNPETGATKWVDPSYAQVRNYIHDAGDSQFFSWLKELIQNTQTPGRLRAASVKVLVDGLQNYFLDRLRDREVRAGTS